MFLGEWRRCRHEQNRSHQRHVQGRIGSWSLNRNQRTSDKELERE
ncbi:hypothetical protein LINPERPRIM_LOCUS26173 [Linum perenne]